MTENGIFNRTCNFVHIVHSVKTAKSQIFSSPVGDNSDVFYSCMDEIQLLIMNSADSLWHYQLEITASELSFFVLRSISVVY